MRTERAELKFKVRPILRLDPSQHVVATVQNRVQMKRGWRRRGEEKEREERRVRPGEERERGASSFFKLENEVMESAADRWGKGGGAGAARRGGEVI